jgi:hypothetical protein
MWSGLEEDMVRLCQTRTSLASLLQREWTSFFGSLVKRKMSLAAPNRRDP